MELLSKDLINLIAGYLNRKDYGYLRLVSKKFRRVLKQKTLFIYKTGGRTYHFFVKDGDIILVAANRRKFTIRENKFGKDDRPIGRQNKERSIITNCLSDYYEYELNGRFLLTILQITVKNTKYEDYVLYCCPILGFETEVWRFEGW